jgi:NADH:ubiquinone oxidoreductase subunit 5 (subunit L)/multisubunit Na+/H+ antiporter MnhA subunit
MEGPAPVSALIHSATMVGIGFLLLLKLAMLYQHNATILYYITFIASFTSFTTSLGGLSCYDVKSINANSTSSQLSFMLLAYGSLNISASYYHFAAHAFFKATLFLISGLLIQQWANRQDVRYITGFLRFQIPSVLAGFITATSSLIGLPASLGSYSKEYILEIAYSKAYNFLISNWFASLFSTVLSILYITLLVSVSLNSRHPNPYRKNKIRKFHGEPQSLSTPVLNLSLLCLILPDFINTLFNITSLFDATFVLYNKNSLNFDYFFNSWYIKVLPFLVLTHLVFFI